MALKDKAIRRLVAVCVASSLTVAPVGLSAQETSTDPNVSGAPVITFSSQDVEMNAAMARARQTLHVFLALIEEQPESAAFLKIALELPDDGVVYKWIEMDDWGGGAPNGRFMAATPALGIARGDPFTATLDQIVDWSVIAPPFDSGPIFGDFTTRVMMARDPDNPSSALASRHQPLPEASGVGLYGE